MKKSQYKPKLLDVNSMAIIKCGHKPTLDRIKSKCTVYIKIDDKRVPLRMFKEYDSPDIIGIPRFLVNKKRPISDAGWEKISFNFTKELREYQKPAVEAILKSYESGDYGGILKAETGTGKSIMALYVASKIGMPVLIVVPLLKILNQWKENILQFTDVKEYEIGIIQSRFEIWQGKKIVLGVLQSLSRRLDKGYSKEMFKYFGLTIWDEGHKLGAYRFSEVVKLFHDKYRLMLSATPRRHDDSDRVFKYHIGNIVYNLSKKLLKPIVYRVKYMGTIGKVFGTNKIRRKGQLLTRMAKDRTRAMTVAALAKTSAKHGRKVAVMADRIELLRKVENELKDSGFKLSKFYSNFRDASGDIILATYQSMGMAVDIPALDTLIMATPRVDVEQAVGRILRLKKGKKRPIVFDIVDMQHRDLVKDSHKRKIYYAKKGYEVKDLDFTERRKRDALRNSGELDRLSA